jgi:hypothetical protein
MSVISDYIRKELRELDKWSESESKRISDWIWLETELT